MTAAELMLLVASNPERFEMLRLYLQKFSHKMTMPLWVLALSLIQILFVVFHFLQGADENMESQFPPLILQWSSPYFIMSLGIAHELFQNKKKMRQQ